MLHNLIEQNLELSLDFASAESKE
jgi:hypothetical protein